MKHFPLLTALLFCCSFLFAQNIRVVDSMPVAGKLFYNLYDSLKPVGKSEKGLIYTLPQYRMPALRPDTSIHYHMPVTNPTTKRFYFLPGNKTPNPLLPPEKQGEKFIITPEGKRRIIIH
ncbi:hypothetical protein PDL71_14135 [Lacibacter sp. MH-610]|uniref:hypothetical protein n=1 Tax=Lacibacter sp. MH-610 TaxID=3020883 RepID=UPI0038926DE0